MVPHGYKDQWIGLALETSGICEDAVRQAPPGAMEAERTVSAPDRDFRSGRKFYSGAIPYLPRFFPVLTETLGLSGGTFPRSRLRYRRAGGGVRAPLRLRIGDSPVERHAVHGRMFQPYSVSCKRN